MIRFLKLIQRLETSLRVSKETGTALQREELAQLGVVLTTTWRWLHISRATTWIRRLRTSTVQTKSHLLMSTWSKSESGVVRYQVIKTCRTSSIRIFKFKFLEPLSKLSWIDNISRPLLTRTICFPKQPLLITEAQSTDQLDNQADLRWILLPLEIVETNPRVLIKPQQMLTIKFKCRDTTPKFDLLKEIFSL